jgi:predicted restriction endonuclease
MDELHSGNYWTDDFDKKFQQKYPETIPNTLSPQNL